MRTLMDNFVDFIIIIFRKSLKLIKINISESQIVEMKEFIKFIIVGFSNVFIALIIYYIFILINKQLYIIGNTVGYIMGVLNSYLWNSQWVFSEKKSQTSYVFLKMCGCYLITFLIQTIVLYLLVNKLQISAVVAPIINISITIPLNFCLNKYWAFR